MIGLVLVVDGLGLHIPKGYVYAAIGFSVLIEILNQLAARGRRKPAAGLRTRQQVADAVLRLLGGVPLPAYAMPAGPVFAPAEREMVGGVLSLDERKVSSIMTPRSEVDVAGPGRPGHPCEAAREPASRIPRRPRLDRQGGRRGAQGRRPRALR